jgi:NAD(P)-dependent dehydrogenase (short-subunit alcohol dehydrogenase family)
MNKTAVVTGAGSGVGRAVAIALAKAHWRVALVGRREEALKETIAIATGLSDQFLLCPCDIGDEATVAKMAATVLGAFPSVELLVNAAGTNTPKRSLEELSLENYRRLMDTNIHGAYYCVQAFVPGMRERKSGTIINIISEAGKAGSAKAGVAYVISKFGMTGLTQSINAEERANGIRACAIFPGDINTPILDLRPNPPPPEARAKMLQPEDVAECVMLVVNLPARAVVEEMLIRPR